MRLNHILLTLSRDIWLTTLERKLLTNKPKFTTTLHVMVVKLTQSLESDTSAASALTLISVKNVKLKSLILTLCWRSEKPNKLQLSSNVNFHTKILMLMSIKANKIPKWISPKLPLNRLILLQVSDLEVRNPQKRKLFTVPDLWKKTLVIDI